MPSSLFLVVSVITAFISILSVSFSTIRGNKHKYNREKKNIPPAYLCGAILATLGIAFGLMTLSNYMGEAMSSAEYASHRIDDLERMVSSLREENRELGYMISSLEKEIYETNLKKHLMMFNTSDYNGIIIPSYSDDGEAKTVSITLDPADGYFIECLDINNNKIDPYLIDDGKWSFVVPDSDITFYIRKNT